MTMGNLRVSLLLAFCATSAVLIWLGSGDENPMLVAVGTSVTLLAIPTLLVGRIQQETPLAMLGIAPISVAVFVLGMAAPALLVVQSWLGGAVFVLLFVAFVVFWRRVKAATSLHHEVLRPSSGDGDVGVFSALTPISRPPTVTPAPQASEPSHSVYDATAARDPMAGLTRPKRAPLEKEDPERDGS